TGGKRRWIAPGFAGRHAGAFVQSAPCVRANKKPPRRSLRRPAMMHHEEVNVLGRPGSDLLFQVLRLSTIGAGKFNGRVRDGIGFGLPANTTRPAKDGDGGRMTENERETSLSLSDFRASWSPSVRRWYATSDFRHRSR